MKTFAYILLGIAFVALIGVLLGYTHQIWIAVMAVYCAFICYPFKYEKKH